MELSAWLAPPDPHSYSDTVCTAYSASYAPTLFPFLSVLSFLHDAPQYHCATNNGTTPAVTKPSAKNAPAVPIPAMSCSTIATPTAPIEHLTRLLIAVLEAPFPGHRSDTKVWLMANTAFDVAAIRNCRNRGTAIQPGREVSPGKEREKP